MSKVRQNGEARRKRIHHHEAQKWQSVMCTTSKKLDDMGKYRAAQVMCMTHQWHGCFLGAVQVQVPNKIKKYHQLTWSFGLC